MAVWVMGGLGAAVVLYGILLYNRLVARRNQVRNAWSQIDVQLKRRHDLVPNLVNTAKGYLAHEQGVLERVVRARQLAIGAGDDVAARAASENQLTGALRSLFALAEAYPDLKANQTMTALHEELVSTENRIAFARQHYGDSVQGYNTTRETFPSILMSGPFGFEEARLFEIELESERAVPEVRF